jgi:hypothetical protein
MFFQSHRLFPPTQSHASSLTFTLVVRRLPSQSYTHTNQTVLTSQIFLEERNNSLPGTWRIILRHPNQTNEEQKRIQLKTNRRGTSANNPSWQGHSTLEFFHRVFQLVFPVCLDFVVLCFHLVFLTVTWIQVSITKGSRSTTHTNWNTNIGYKHKNVFGVSNLMGYTGSNTSQSCRWMERDKLEAGRWKQIRLPLLFP